MAMVRSLGPEHKHFVYSLVLLPQFDFKTLKEAFIVEQSNGPKPGEIDALSEAASVAKVVPHTHKGSHASGTASPRIICGFCDTWNHTEDACKLFAMYKAKAKLEAEESRRNRRGKRHNNSSNSGNTSTALSSSPAPPVHSNNNVQHANSAKVSNTDVEYAGSASISLPDSHAQVSLSSCWVADTGATSHMTPHRHWFVLELVTLSSCYIM